MNFIKKSIFHTLLNKFLQKKKLAIAEVSFIYFKRVGEIFVIFLITPWLNFLSTVINDRNYQIKNIFDILVIEETFLL